MSTFHMLFVAMLVIIVIILDSTGWQAFCITLVIFCCAQHLQSTKKATHSAELKVHATRIAPGRTRATTQFDLIPDAISSDLQTGKSYQAAILVHLVKNLPV